MHNIIKFMSLKMMFEFLAQAFKSLELARYVMLISLSYH